MTDRTAESLKGMSVHIRMGFKGLRGINKSWVLDTEMTGLATVGSIQFPNPALPNAKMKVGNLCLPCGFLDQMFFELLLVGKVWRVVFFPDLPQKEEEQHQTHNNKSPRYLIVYHIKPRCVLSHVTLIESDSIRV